MHGWAQTQQRQGRRWRTTAGEEGQRKFAGITRSTPPSPVAREPALEAPGVLAPPPAPPFLRSVASLASYSSFSFSISRISVSLRRDSSCGEHRDVYEAPSAAETQAAATARIGICLRGSAARHARWGRSDL